MTVDASRSCLGLGTCFGSMARQIQGLGRTNRTSQAQPPLFRPITTDVKPEKRLLSDSGVGFPAGFDQVVDSQPPVPRR